MKWLCSAWQGVVHNSPLLTITSADFNATDYDEICMCPSILDASETVEFACLPTEPKEEFFEYNLCGEIWLDQNQFKEKCKNQGDRIALTDANDQRVKAQMAVTTANFMIDSFKEFIEGMEVGENVKFLGFKLTVNPIRARGCRFYLGVKSPEQVVEEKNGTYDKDKYFEIGRGNS